MNERHRRPWQPDEDSALRQLLPTRSLGTIAEGLGRTPHAVRMRVRVLGLEMKPRQVSIKAFARQQGYDPSVVEAWVKKLGLFLPPMPVRDPRSGERRAAGARARLGLTPYQQERLADALASHVVGTRPGEARRSKGAWLQASRRAVRSPTCSTKASGSRSVAASSAASRVSSDSP